MTNEDIYYRIKIKSHLESHWQDWFDDLSITLTDDGDTILGGVIEDQAALHGVLKRIRNLGLTILSVNPQEKGENTLKTKEIKKTARIAGILYIIMAVFLIFSGMYVDPKLYVPGDALSTVSNILASAWLFRLGIVGNLVGYILNLFLVLALYNLFKSVDKGQARLMVILIVAGVSIAFLNMLNQYAPILLFSGAGHLSAFNPAQLQTLAMVFLDIYNHGIMLAEIFWGLWLIPLGLLVYKSGFVPKVLGVLLIIGCFGHLISFLSIFLFPGYSTILTPIAETMMFGEMPIFLWLLIKGVIDQQLTTTEAI